MRTNVSILLMLIYVITSCSTSNNISKCSMPFEDRGEITLNRAFVDDGTQLILETSDPVALRTLLMQGFLLQLYGINTDTTIVKFPSAKDVGDKIAHHPGEVKATLQGEKEKRPDMRPLVAALNKANVLVSRKGAKTVALQEGYEVSINPSNGMLTYSITLPDNWGIEGNCSIALLSQPDISMVENGEFASRGYTNRSENKHPQPFGANGRKDDTNHRKTINILFDFSNRK